MFPRFSEILEREKKYASMRMTASSCSDRNSIAAVAPEPAGILVTSSVDPRMEDLDRFF